MPVPPARPAFLRRAEPGSRLPREVYVLGLIAFCVAVGFGVLVPVLPVFARSFGVDNFEVGAVVSAFALMRLVCSGVTVAALWLLWQTAKGQAGCPNTETIRMGQMNRRLMMGMLGAVLLTASANAGWLVRHILSNPVTRFVSAVSMQFYIWHQTIAVWLLKARVIPSVCANPNYEGDLLWQKRYTFACFAVSLLAAAALTYGFERPIARRLLQKKRENTAK